MFTSPPRFGSAQFGFFNNFNGLWTGTPTVNYTFANGTEGVWTTRALFNRRAWSYTSGEELFNQFCLPSPETSSSESATPSPSEPALAPAQTNGPQFYPRPVMHDPYNQVAGFYLNGTYEDTAVLFVPTFTASGEDPISGLELPDNQTTQFGRVAADFLLQAKADNKTKLILDFSGNGGGTTLVGFNLFKILFPQTNIYSANRLRDHEFSRLLMKAFDTWAEDESVTDNFFLHFGWAGQVSPTQDKLNWSSYLDFTGPQSSNLTTPTAFVNFTAAWSEELSVEGYNQSTTFATPPFAAEDILIVTDGACASTCSIVVELLTNVVGVNKTLVFGGRPSPSNGRPEPMQLVGGTRGSEQYDWSRLADVANETLYYVQGRSSDSKPTLTPDEISHYKDLMPIFPDEFPLNFRGGSLNLRNGYSKDSDIPLQFVNDPAKCRLYYTRANILEPATTWTDAADAIWGSKGCVAVDETAQGPKQSNGSIGGGEQNGTVSLGARLSTLLVAMVISIFLSLL